MHDTPLYLEPRIWDATVFAKYIEEAMDHAYFAFPTRVNITGRRCIWSVKDVLNMLLVSNRWSRLFDDQSCLDLETSVEELMV